MDKTMIDIRQLMTLLPHRYPFLLVDKVIDIRGDEHGIGIKNVTANEPQFAGHFPGKPIMPGVLIIESMAQTGGFLLLQEVKDREKKLVYFVAIDDARFRRPVVPGDQLRIEVEVMGWRVVPRMTAAKMHGVAYVAGKRVAEATVSCQLIDSSRGRAENSEDADDDAAAE